MINGSFPLKERWDDLYHPAKQVFFEAGTRSLLDLAAKKVVDYLFPQAVFFSSLRFLQSFLCVNNLFFPGDSFNGAVLLCPETIENGKALQKKQPASRDGKITIFTSKELIHQEKIAPASKERYYYVLSRVKKIAARMGLSNPVQIYTQWKEMNRSCGAATVPKTPLLSTPIQIYIGHGLLKEADHVIDFILAHELAHSKGNHIFNKCFFNMTIWFADISCLIYCPLLIFLVETVAVVWESFLARKYEKEADFLAMETLATNRGAVAFFKNTILDNRVIKLLQISKSIKTPRLKEFLQERKNSLTLEGNEREDLDHPPLTERLTYAQAFIGDQKGHRHMFAHRMA